MVLFATVCYGFAFNIAPPLQARYGAVVLMSSVLTVASLATLPYMLITAGENEWEWQPAIALVVLGAVGTGIAYWVMVTLVGRVGSLRASLITYLIPVVALVLGMSLRGDVVTVLALIGAPVTIVGAYLASRPAP
jgi:drug/metabolite transporter (DMT)-like permease